MYTSVTNLCSCYIVDLVYILFRHLHSELIRVNVEEPTNKGSEASSRDISFSENGMAFLYQALISLS